jgi:hypothetical protein
MTTMAPKILLFFLLWQYFWFDTISSSNKTDRHDITEILLKVALNTIKQRNIENLILLFNYR